MTAPLDGVTDFLRDHVASSQLSLICDCVQHASVPPKGKITIDTSVMKTPENGSRLLAKMRDDSGAFEEEEIFDDFSKLYKRFVRRNRNELSDFFKRESRDILRQLFDDFEGRVLGR